MLSVAYNKIAATTTMTTTMIDATIVSLRVVQVTLRPSARTWLKNVMGPVRFLGGVLEAVSEVPVGVFMIFRGLDGTV